MISQYYSLGFLLAFSLCFGLEVASAQIRWTRTIPGQNKVVVFRPGAEGKVVYAVPHDSIGSIHISWDGGYSWARTRGETAPLEPNGRSYARQIWIDPTDSNNVLLGSSDQHLGVMRSIDGGRNWENVIFDILVLGESIYEVPDGSGMLMCGSSGIAKLWKSGDRGATWDSVSIISIHNPNVCVIGGKPGSSTDILVGSGGGYISKSTDAGKNWRIVVQGDDLGLSDVPMIQFDPRNPNRAWATFYFNKLRSVARTIDGGETWQDLPARSNQWALKVNHADPDMLFLGRFQALDTVGGTFFRSIDGGDSWEDLGLDSITDVWQIDYDTASGRLAMATSNGLFIGETKMKSVAGEQPELQASVTVNYRLWQAKVYAPEGSSVEISDNNGRKLLTRNVVGSASTIDVADWPTGVYFAHIRHNNGYALRRFTLLR